MKATVSPTGEIQLPPEIQAKLGVKPGDDVFLETENGHCVIRREQPKSGLAWKGNLLVHCGVCNAILDNTLTEIREERLDELSKGVAP